MTPRHRFWIPNEIISCAIILTVFRLPVRCFSLSIQFTLTQRTNEQEPSQWVTLGVVWTICSGLSISVQTLRINFSFPFTRENILGLGMGDASKKCLGRALSNKRPGDSAVLVTEVPGKFVHTTLRCQSRPEDT